MLQKTEHVRAKEDVRYPCHEANLCVRGTRNFTGEASDSSARASAGKRKGSRVLSLFSPPPSNLESATHASLVVTIMNATEN